MPDFVPCNPDAGGDRGCRDMIAELHRMGVGAVILYGHPYYNHPLARDYVAEADTGYEELNKVWEDIGNVACADAEAWQELWRQSYIPAYEDSGAAGVYWDQGPTQYLVCPKDTHAHGLRTIDQLSAHVRGVLRLQEASREGYKNRQPLMWTEVGSDLQGRTMDIWTATDGGFAAGGVCRREIGRYAIPYRLCAATTPTSAADMNDTLVIHVLPCLQSLPLSAVNRHRTAREIGLNRP